MFSKLIKMLMFEKIKIWLKENGFVGAATLIVAVAALILGMKFLMWGSLGFFLGKNWEIIGKLWNEKYKEEVEDVIDDIKEKIVK